MNRKIIYALISIFSYLQISIAQPPQRGMIITTANLDWEDEGVVVERIPTFALKTNLLLDALSIINIGVEVPLFSHWSISAACVFPWWYNPSKQRCVEIISGEIQGRYWIENHTAIHNLNGWFVGGYMSGGHYDLERRWQGVQGRMWGGGVCGGYAHRVWCNLRLEYSLGVGVTHTSYDKYSAVWDCQEQLRLLRYAYGTYNLWGITKVEVSVVWMLNIVKKE
ncbi:MAG: DUF3575 domain-containing protein [Rikenellaceae bacterium]